MNAPAVHWSDFGMDTTSLAGPLEAKLRAMRDAGFGQVMLSASDLTGHSGGVEAAIRAVRSSGLRVTAFNALRDFEGLAEALHEYKVDVAKSLIEMCAAVDSPVLVATSSALDHASTDLDVVARDLRKLAMLALPSGVRISYIALSWGRAVDDFAKALEVVGRAGMPNLGVGIDSFHALAVGAGFDELETTLPETIFTVQLSDFMVAELASNEEMVAAASHLRVFPGEGMHSAWLAGLVRRLGAIGYDGDFIFSVFNDDYHQMDGARVAQRAARAASWMGEEVLKRAVPMPGAMRLARREAG